MNRLPLILLSVCAALTGSSTSRLAVGGACSSLSACFMGHKAIFALPTLLAAGSILILTGCSTSLPTGGGAAGGGEKTLIVQGSDTMEKMVQAWSAAYIKDHPDVQISVKSGDTGIGIEDLIEGKIGLAAASRELEPREDQEAHSKRVHLIRTMVAKDALAIVVGQKNPVTTLTMSELKGIFGGEIKKWSQIKSRPQAAEDSDIVVLGREASSGSGEYLRDHILAGKEFGTAVKLMPSSQAVIDGVVKQKGAVGFVGMSQAEKAGDKIKVVTLKLNESSPDGAREDNLTGQDYPLERPLYLYSNASAADLTKSFVQFCQSEGGQKIVKDMGFMAIR